MKIHRDPLVRQKTASGDVEWALRVIPLPKELRVEGCAAFRAGEISVSLPPAPDARLQTAEEILKRFARGNGQSQFVIKLLFVDNADPEFPIERFRSLPNRDQAYAIVPELKDGAFRGLKLFAETSLGLLYAARTLAQLVSIKGGVGKDRAITIPKATVLDWPDISQRGQWGGNCQDDMPWMAERKLNVVEMLLAPKLDKNNQPVIEFDAEKASHGWAVGVAVVPAIIHLEQLAKESWSASLLAVPEPGKALPSDYVPGLCLSQEAVCALIGEWFARLAARPQVTDIMVWLSEDRAQCFCSKCIGKEPFLLELDCIVQAFKRAKAIKPEIVLRVLLSQGSYPVNDKILEAAPSDVRVTYYSGVLTYDSSHAPMIYPALEEFAAKGRWLGVYPQVTHAWRAVFPWTAPQFIQYRMREFAAKKLSCVICYAVPSNRFHEFNLTAAAEFSWNSQGRSVRDFARAYAFRVGMASPERFADWTELAGPVGWDLAESRLFLSLIYNPAMGMKDGVPPDHRFRTAELVVSQKLLEKDIVLARQALKIARETAEADMIAESECLLAGLHVIKALSIVSPAAQASGSEKTATREKLAQALEFLDEAACVLQTRLLRWGRRVVGASGGKELPERLYDTAFVVSRTACFAREVGARFDVPDPLPDYRIKKVGEWSAALFRDSPKPVISLNITDALNGSGEYVIGFDFIDSAWGFSPQRIAVVQENHGKRSVLHEVVSAGWRVSRWSRWLDILVAVPAVRQGANCFLEIEASGLPENAPQDRRTCSGSISIRKAWREDDASGVFF